MADRLAHYKTTSKQRGFESDFMKGAEDYEVWDEVDVGVERACSQTFEVKEEDILAYNLAVMETHPLLVDPAYARLHSPTGSLLPHPLFLVEIAFYCIDRGPTNWIRSPGARNPGQLIELHEHFRPGEVISVQATCCDKWIRRGNHYLQAKLDFKNQDGTLKATWWLTLILPPNRAELLKYVEAGQEVAR
jgi:acyl dehydratase